MKADRRLVTQAAGSRTYRTTLAPQAYLDDLFLRPGAVVRLSLPDLGGQLLVLPIVGGALLTTTQVADQPLVPGCLYTIPTAEAGSLTLTNPFEKETVNLLLIQAPVPTAASAAVREAELPLTAKNELVSPAGPAWPVRVGLYDSRVKGSLLPSNPTDISLCYVINGSFEIEDRLAEHRDALLLWATPRIDFEALSETAILFYLEFSATR